jgi:ferredoxin
MVKVIFIPQKVGLEVDEGTKILVAARKGQTGIRFGCASCRCGTCGVRVDTKQGSISPMKSEEKDLLERMSLPLDGSVRLACQARVLTGEIKVDLDFQMEYDPDQGDF